MCDSVTDGCSGYQRLTRRRLLQSTTGLAAGAWLTQFAERLAQAADSKRSSQRPKSLLMLWLQGGPSQLETFDPHPGTSIGGDAKGLSTSITGTQISDLMPATAQQMHHACLVRSMISKEGDHERATYHLKTGWRPDPTLVHPSIGSIICRQSKDNIEIPRHISIIPGQWPSRGGYLGPSFDAFQIGDPAQPIPNLTARVNEEQLQDRLGPLLDVMETEFQRGRLANLDEKRTLHRAATKQAVTMMNSDQLTAFDVQAESQTTRDRFGDSPFGRGCLAGIRLLSAGVRCVEVELSGWDSHVNNHELQSNKAKVLDLALAATMEELAERDLLDDTVVFCGGEFGRTPKINPAGGRDHWPHGFSILLAGGSFRRGYVHGETAANPDPQLLSGSGENKFDPERVTKNTVTVPDLHATLLHALGIDHELDRITPIGRPLRWSDGNIVPALLQA
ncbi:MAG: DUF1501 domain-containing protein [Pirellulaceae bacterium]